MAIKKYHIYCDESGIVEERYITVGGIVFESSYYTELLNIINKYKDNAHEIKFTKIKGQKILNLYTNIITDLLSTQKIHFRCVVFDTQDIDHTKHNPNITKRRAHEIGWYKLHYYQTLYHQFIKMNNGSHYNIFLDERPPYYQTNSILKALKDSLMHRAIEKNNEIDRIDFVSSDGNAFIQIADLLCGSVNFIQNPKQDNKGYKGQFTKQLAKIVNVDNLAKDSGWKKDWKVWHWKK